MRNLQQKKKYMLPLVVLILVCFSGCMRSPGGAEPSETSAVTTEPARQPREGLQTLLIACLDSYDVPPNSDSYRNGNRADLLMVMVIDEKRGVTTALQLNPDTVVPFCPPGTSETVQIPLGVVVSFGSGGSDSCLSELKAVSNLLGGVPIDHYMTFTMDSIAIVNDMLGGVTVALMQDEFAQEETMTLMGEEAIEFFLLRENGDVTNEAHMERQRQYMAGVYAPFMDKAQQEDFLTRLTLQLGERFETDLTLSQMTQILQSLESYGLDETVLTLQGTAEKADGVFQFHVAPDSLEQMVERLFFAQ